MINWAMHELENFGIHGAEDVDRICKIVLEQKL